MTAGRRNKADLISRLFIGALLLGCLAVVIHALRMLSVDEDWAYRLLSWAGGAALVFGVLLVVPVSLRANLTVTLVVVLICAYAFNAYLAFTPPPDVAKAEAIGAKRKATPGFDHRAPLEVVRDLREAGADAVPALFGVNALNDEKRPKDLLPLIGISTATTVLCNELGEYAIYVADEHGHRNPPGLPEQVDVLLLGDSFMQGQCVGPGRDLAGLLRRRGFSVYTLGSSGNGPLLSFAALMEYGLRKKPKVVIWGYAGNDPSDLLPEMNHPTLVRYLDDAEFTQRLVERQVEIDAFWRDHLERQDYLSEKQIKEVMVWKAPTPSLLELGTLYNLRRLLGLRRSQRGSWKGTFQRILQTARERVEAQGGKMYFLGFPYYELVTNPPPAERTIFGIVRPTGVPIIDLDQPFFEAKDPEAYFPLRMPGHFSEEGYAFVAEIIASQVVIE